MARHFCSPCSAVQPSSKAKLAAGKGFYIPINTRCPVRSRVVVVVRFISTPQGGGGRTVRSFLRCSRLRRDGLSSMSPCPCPLLTLSLTPHELVRVCWFSSSWCVWERVYSRLLVCVLGEPRFAFVWESLDSCSCVWGGIEGKPVKFETVFCNHWVECTMCYTCFSDCFSGIGRHGRLPHLPSPVPHSPLALRMIVDVDWLWL